MIHDAWQRLLARGPSWFWLAHGAKNGDFYHACTLARAFRDTHGSDVPIRLVVGSRPLMDVAALFGDVFAECIHMGEFSVPADAWRTFFANTGLPAFGVDTPILVHPLTNPETSGLGGFVAENGLTWLSLYRHVLRLDRDARPSPPPVLPDLIEAGMALCSDAAVPRGRAAVMFPYAQSFPVSAHAHFARLSERLRARGIEPYTSVVGAEVPVPGTRPLAIPFSLLPSVVEHAGWAVAVRSGICDILAPTRARKSFIFRHGRELPLWSVAGFDLARDAFEIPFDFATRSPDDFADAVLDDAAPLPPVPRARGISAEIGGRPGDPPTLDLSFTEVQRGQASTTAWTEQATRHLESGPALLRIADLPPRDHPAWSGTARRTLATLSAATDPASSGWFACRDRPGFDAFEPLDRESLVGARYGAAADWHSIVAVAGTELAHVLAPGSRIRVLDASPMRPGVPVVIADGWGGPAVRAYADGYRPLSFGGLQLLDGWHEPEPWGVWSRGCRVRLGVSVAEPIGAGFTLRLEGDVAASPAFPELAAGIVINDTAAGTVVLRPGDTRVDVVVPPCVAREARHFIVRLQFGRVVSPCEQGAGPDTRLLGLGLRRAELIVATAAETARPDQEGIHP